MEKIKEIPQGYKKTPVGIIPEDWEVKKLGEIGTVINGLTYSPDNIRDKGTLVLRSSNIQNSALSFDDNVYVDTSDLKFNPVKKNDILICVRNGSKSLIGKNALIISQVEGEAFGAFMSIYRSEINEYIFQFFRTDEYQRQINQNLGATINSINNNELRQFKLPIPPLPEQTAIADCLSTWDKGIEKLSALIASKKEQKKGLMQGLFSGKLKVENGQLVKVEDEKLWLKGWKEVRLGEMFKQVKRPINWDDNEYYKLISIRRRSGGIFHRETLKGEEIRTKNLYDVKEGDFLISKMQVLHGASAIVSKENEGMKVSGSYITLVPKKPKTINMSFFKYFSTQPYFYHLTYRSSYGVHIEKMTFKLELLYKEKITIPSYNEQYAIAKILQVVDKEIELLEKKLEAFKIQKKGLMQVLLTGEKRLLVNS